MLLVGLALAVASAMFVDHRRAQAAADLGALAGAQALQGGGDGCARAGAVVSANGASLSRCLVTGRVIEVEVVVPGPDWLVGSLGRRGDLVGRARAGPGATAP